MKGIFPSLAAIMGEWPPRRSDSTEVGENSRMGYAINAFIIQIGESEKNRHRSYSILPL